MAVGKTVLHGLAVSVCLILLVMPASAGVLNGHVDAYNDGMGPGVDGAWTMTTPFNNGVDLVGTVDWAVFGPGEFPFTTGGGWAPTAGELSYVYQVFITGSDAASSYAVYVANPADNIGAFQDAGAGITGVLPDDPASLTIPGSAYWTFSLGISEGDNSSGLAFSSPNLPEATLSIVVDGGDFVVAIPVPTPSSVAIPEPGTWILLFTGLGLVAMKFRRRMR